MSYFYWYPNAPTSTLTYRCYRFAIQHSDPWKELIQSLFSLKLGVFMTGSCWLAIAATVQLVYYKPIWQLSMNLLARTTSTMSKVVLLLLAYEFVVSKFPQYIREVVISELCATSSIWSDEVRNVICNSSIKFLVKHT